MKKCLWLLFYIAFFTPLVGVVSAASDPLSLGKVADNLMSPVGLMSDFIDTACFGIGGAFVFTSFIKYFEHKRSPLMVPISTVIFLLLAGILLIALPFLGLWTAGGIRYSLMS